MSLFPISPSPVRIADEQVALFVSDIHLGEHDPATARRFQSELRQQAPGATHLFLLGDVFEAWVGDDQDDELARAMVDVLRPLADAGQAIFLMRGNRDFLLDAPVGAAPCIEPFSRRIGARLLEDPTVIELFGARVLLTHGDALCTDDAAYQQFRLQTRHPAWQQRTLAQPLAARLAMARAMRAQSMAANAGKSMELMDVNPQAVERMMRESEVNVMIQGHTHRPAHHRFMLDDRPAQRWVLPDWDASQGRGGWLKVDRHGWHRLGHWPS